MNHLIVGIVLAGAAIAAPAWAQETPAQLKGGKVISVEEGKRLLDAKAAAFFDTRSVINFGKGHVPGAKSASYKEKSEKTADFDGSKDDLDLTKLPPDKGAKLVFYSDGPTGWKSYKAAVLALKQGYSQVMYMRGGFGEWTDKRLPVEQ